MKKLFILMMLSIMIVKADTIMIEKINHTLEQIKYEANQKPSVNLDIKYDPFYHDTKLSAPQVKKNNTLVKTTKRSKKPLVLSMILNKQAFINGVWYSKNQKVAQFMLDKVNQDSVVLKRKNKTIVLKLKTANNLLVKKEVL